MDNTAIVPAQRDLTPSVWQMIWEIAPVMYKSRLFGVSSVEQAAAIMLKGYEIGLSITASFELVQVVQGKPSLTPRGALAMLHNSPEIATIEITRLTDAAGAFAGYQCHMARRNGFEHTAAFTLADAKRAGLVKPDSGWANYPENMCLWRAIGFAADVVAPDITAGLTGLMKAPERFGVTITQAGDIIDATPVIPTLDELVAQYGADMILAANDGQLPSTPDELRAIAERLA